CASVLKCQILSLFFAAGTISVRVQVELWFWLWVCGPEQGAEESAIPRKRSSREEPSTQPAAGLPHSAGITRVVPSLVHSLPILYRVEGKALSSLQAALPSVPPDTKLSKLDVLVLATNYIAYLTETLDQGGTLTEQTLLGSRPGPAPICLCVFPCIFPPFPVSLHCHKKPLWPKMEKKKKNYTFSHGLTKVAIHSTWRYPSASSKDPQAFQA
uniref:BHLH domain-containing protein n=1 Tax=Amphilophus citrinellus TaxID=61819 RepID=A0A3Q0RUR0_AMPCI